MQNIWLGNNNKAMAFVRVSGRGQEHNTSHSTQENDIREYCKLNGLDLLDVIHVVESAKESKLRKMYQRFCKTSERLGVRHRIFHRADREGRNFTDIETGESDVLADRYVLHYVVERLVLHKDSPDIDFLMRDYQAVNNKHYSRDLKSKVSRAVRAKALSGWYPGCIPPLGYVHQKLISTNGFERRRGSTVVQAAPQLVSWVRREFELRAPDVKGNYRSLKEVRDQVLAEGIVPSKKIQSYSVSSLECRLKNKFYDGRFDWGGVEYEGKHERIIPKDLYWSVQETFGKKNPYRKSAGVFDGGWLRCAEPSCGCHIVYDPKTKTLASTGEKVTYRYYHCTNGKGVHKTLRGMNMSEEKIWDQFATAVSSITITENFAQQLAEAMNATQKKAQEAIRLEIRSYQGAIEQLNDKFDRLLEFYHSGELEQNEYKRLRDKVRKEQRHLSKELERANLMISDVTCENAKTILELATNAESLWKRRSPLERRDFLEKLLSNYALDGVNVRYELRKPFKILSEMWQNEDWRRRADSNRRYWLPNTVV